MKPKFCRLINGQIAQIITTCGEAVYSTIDSPEVLEWIEQETMQYNTLHCKGQVIDCKGIVKELLNPGAKTPEDKGFVYYPGVGYVESAAAKVFDKWKENNV